jgi:NAD(P)H-hydrate epimerase
MKVSSVAEMRELDRRAIEEHGIPDVLLMENAGLAAFWVIAGERGVEGRKFLVFCGGGNNGGDGLVVARLIHASGGIPRVFLLSSPEKYQGAARVNYEIVHKLPVEMKRIDSIEGLDIQLAHCDVAVDAIFGTGLAREVGGLYREVVEVINRSGRPVISLDIPSGIHGDTGEVMGAAVRADATITFGLPKTGNLLYPGFAHCGKLFVTHISFPPALYGHIRTQINRPATLPPRQPDGSKSTFGKALFIAGAAGYYGAPYLAAMGFLKGGGGYARLATPASVAPVIAANGPEIVFLPQKETGSGSLSFSNLDSLLKLANQMDFVVLGPGLSLEEETQRLARELAARIEGPLLVDGDGITALCADLDILRRRTAPTVLTPHPGEMARLTGLSIEEVLARRLDLLRETCQELNAITVLKGAHSLIGTPDGEVHINMSGNSGMGTAGSGDVLTGSIAAVYGLGVGVEESVRTGVFLHGLAGDLAAETLGEDGITAGDVLEYLPVAVKTFREGLPPDLARRYAGAEII